MKKPYTIPDTITITTTKHTVVVVLNCAPWREGFTYRNISRKQALTLAKKHAGNRFDRVLSFRSSKIKFMVDTLPMLKAARDILKKLSENNLQEISCAVTKKR